MVNPSKWVNLKSNFLKFHHRNQAISGIEKARKMAYFRAFLALLSCRLSLAELRRATSGLEAVFLTLFHSRITSQESCFFQNWSVVVVYSQKGTCNTVTDCSCLSCVSAAVNVYDHVKFISGLCSCQRLTNDNFQGLQTKILIDVSFIDSDFTNFKLNDNLDPKVLKENDIFIGKINTTIKFAGKRKRLYNMLGVYKVIRKYDANKLELVNHVSNTYKTSTSATKILNYEINKKNIKFH